MLVCCAQECGSGGRMREDLLHKGMELSEKTCCTSEWTSAVLKPVLPRWTFIA